MAIRQPTLVAFLGQVGLSEEGFNQVGAGYQLSMFFCLFRFLFVSNSTQRNIMTQQYLMSVGIGRLGVQTYIGFPFKINRSGENP